LRRGISTCVNPRIGRRNSKMDHPTNSGRRSDSQSYTTRPCGRPITHKPKSARRNRKGPARMRGSCTEMRAAARDQDHLRGAQLRGRPPLSEETRSHPTAPTVTSIVVDVALGRPVRTSARRSAGAYGAAAAWPAPCGVHVGMPRSSRTMPIVCSHALPEIDLSRGCLTRLGPGLHRREHGGRDRNGGEEGTC